MSTETATRGPSGTTMIFGATIIAGISGYLVTWLVLRTAGPASYALFAVFWSALYLLVGALAGVQQEITRATRPTSVIGHKHASRAVGFGFVAATVVAVLIVGTAPGWADHVFVGHGWTLVWPLTVGAAAYVLVATLCGSLYGVSQWRSLALMIAADAILRIVLVGFGLLLDFDIIGLAWLVAIPFPLVIVLLWPVVRGGFVGRSELDVGYRALTWNILRTVLASLSTALIVSGFPLLLGVVGADVNRSLLGELIFTITIARAPLIVSVLSLQSLLLVRFRDSPARSRSTFLIVMGAIGAGVVVLALAGWLLGPAVLSLLSGFPTQIHGRFIAVIVVSSGLIAALAVSASAVLAVGKHVIYLLGWVVAAVVMVGVLLSPLDFLFRVGLSLLVGPLAGLLLQLTWLFVRAWRGAR